MHTIAKRGLSLSITFYAVLHFITYFYEHSMLLHFLAVFGMGIFLFAILSRTIQKMKLPFGLFLVGFIILIFSETSVIEGLENGFLHMRNMIGLLVIVPMISWVLREEPYMEAIIGLGNKLLNTSRKFYFGVVSFTQIISYFLLFGSIPMMYHFVNEILKEEKGEAWENFKGTALLRGFALSTFWVISMPNFAFIVEVMDASLWISILQGFGMSVCGIIIALVFSYFDEKRYGVDLTSGLQTEIEEVVSHSANNRQMKRKIIEFALLFFSLFGSIFIVQAIVPVELLVLIPLVVVVWIFIYYLLKKRPHKLIKKANMYVNHDMSGQSYQLCVMLGAGMMIFALNQTGFAAFVVDGIYSLQEMVPFLNILYFLPFIVIILGFFGLGPLTVMVLVGGILGSLDLPYPPELIVLAVTSGSAISILLSPLIMPVIVLSGANGLSGFRNGVGFNWKYAVVIYLTVQVWVQGLVYLG
ncbi:hypothetical protein [Lentibacillus sediminis]|uniref:hypothetical protein n=1 Tax=Lentibacillus sediminis TaxID=1940529 RepID=UPI000C1C1825|nr:hypothetical protein [Lentibacillus sediminis]